MTKEEIYQEGKRIAEELGNGVRYAGPFLDEDGRLEFHLFNDDDVTDSSFSAVNLKEARSKLIEVRRRFNAPPPAFKKGP